jgi:site-specific DNA-cytosine methylase
LLGGQLAFDDPRSKLFFEYARILDECRAINPNVKFLLENVRMKKQSLDTISTYLGVEPVRINSSLVSAQNRVREYWANWSFEQPEDKGLFLKDIIESGVVDRDKSYCVDANYFKGGNAKSYTEKHRRQLVTAHNYAVEELVAMQSNADGTVCEKPLSGYAPTVRKNVMDHSKSSEEKAVALTTNSNFGGDGVTVLRNENTLRKLTVTEVERLQTLPDGYTAGVSNTQRYKQCGNGWTVDVIAHILKASV